jgi:hypothetical protein
MSTTKSRRSEIKQSVSDPKTNQSEKNTTPQRRKLRFQILHGIQNGNTFSSDRKSKSKLREKI